MNCVLLDDQLEDVVQDLTIMHDCILFANVSTAVRYVVFTMGCVVCSGHNSNKAM